MTQSEQIALAEGYYQQAMRMIEDKERGLTEFVNPDEVWQLIYDIANDFYSSTLGEL